MGKFRTFVLFTAVFVFLALFAAPARADVAPLRNGPFRSCGSGIGTGLTGIGMAWAVLWVGFRLTGRGRDSARRDR